MPDVLIRATAHDNQFRVFAVNCTAAVQKARDLHDLSPLATLLLGKLLTAVAMMSWDLKHPQAEVTLRVDGDGALEGAVAICNAEGMLRGYAHNPKLLIEDKLKDNFFIGKHLGKGTITTIRNDAKSKPYTGTCALVSGEIAEDLAEYYLQSEQISTAVNLGILIDKDARVRAAGGFIIQQMPLVSHDNAAKVGSGGSASASTMPFADLQVADMLSSNIQATPNVSDLMDMGYSIEDILSKFVFKGISWQKHEEKSIAYACTCSRDKFSKALLLLGKKELSEMASGIEPVCQYCNTVYVFSHDDMINMINNL